MLLLQRKFQCGSEGPEEVQVLQQLRCAPVSGLRYGVAFNEFLSSLRGMAQATGKALEVFRENGVEPIVESKVRSNTDLNKLSAILDKDTTTLYALLDEESPPASAEPKKPTSEDKVPADEGSGYGKGKGIQRRPGMAVAQDKAEQRFPAVKRRWGKGRQDKMCSL
eukprot:Skav224723  [mRNA]  locus=scaffold699:505458:508609:+ [translate_table: standard]